MAEATQCARCQKALQSEWSVCPYCGQSRTQAMMPVALTQAMMPVALTQAMMPVTLVPSAIRDTFANPESSAGPYDFGSVNQNVAPAPEATRRDTSLAGIGLIAVGATGSVVLLRTLGSTRLGIDAVMQIAGLLVLIMIVGVVLAARGKSTVAAILSGIVGGVITVLMAALIGILIFVSFVLYLIHDCLRILGQN